MSHQLVISIVAYKNDPQEIKNVLASALITSLKVKLILVDNSPTDDLRVLCSDDRVEYVFNGKNLGFGGGHNSALRRSSGEYHLVLNPDVTFGEGVLERLYNFMNSNPSVGLLMPKVLNLDGSIQHLCRRVPTPLDLIARRFLPASFKAIIRKRLDWHELKDCSYDQTMDVPCLSGCFMFIRNSILSGSGLFDQRFFMYLEDVDLSRRIHSISRTIYFPHVEVIHGFKKASYKHASHLFQHVKSTILYFNKWGWFFDPVRNQANRDAGLRGHLNSDSLVDVEH